MTIARWLSHGGASQGNQEIKPSADLRGREETVYAILYVYNIYVNISFLGYKNAKIQPLREISFDSFYFLSLLLCLRLYLNLFICMYYDPTHFVASNIHICFRVSKSAYHAALLSQSLHPPISLVYSRLSIGASEISKILLCQVIVGLPVRLIDQV